MLSSRLSFALSLIASLVAAQTCKLQFDGRVPTDLTIVDFDKANDFFSEKFVIGQGLTFSDALRLLPAGAGSLVRFSQHFLSPVKEFDPLTQPQFDLDSKAQPAEVLISDNSIFNGQVGFRRAELLPVSNDGSDPSTQGVKTLHFSVLQDVVRPLNLSHEYQLAFLESKDFSTNQFVLKTGTILGQKTADPNTLQLFGNLNQGKLLFSTAFEPSTFHNFALKLDFNKLYVTQPLRSPPEVIC